MTNTIDLHVHTTASDGLYTPADVVALAREVKLRVIAISDHDTVEGIAEAVEAARGTELEVIPAIEISTELDGTEYHILGYYLDYTRPDLAAELADSCAARLERGKKMLARLRELGMPLSWDRVLELAGDGALGRPHIARALEEAGYVESSQEAFDRYLGYDKPAYVSRVKMTPYQAIEMIRGAGGVAVLAHPWGLPPIIPELVAGGLQGLEVYYPKYGPEVIGYLCQWVRRYGLVSTGGSDFHGLALLPDNPLGGVHVPESCVEKLRQQRDQGQAHA
jgi:predicted metal-dependent phosphoesterase TrpH